MKGTEPMNRNIVVPVMHPGEILREEYLAPLGLSAGALARKLGVPRTRIERVVAEETPITINTALRLSKFFSTTPEFWLSMQIAYDLHRETEAIRAELDAIPALEAA